MIKDEGQSWTGEYFRQTILQENLIPFLKTVHVVDVQQVTLLHDKAPCFKALATQQMLRDSSADYFDNSQWPSNSPDLNLCENLGAILKDKVERRLHHDADRFHMPTFRGILDDVLSKLENDTALFEALLKTFPKRLRAVEAGQGGHTEF